MPSQMTNSSKKHFNDSAKSDKHKRKHEDFRQKYQKFINNPNVQEAAKRFVAVARKNPVITLGLVVVFLAFAFPIFFFLLFAIVNVAFVFTGFVLVEVTIITIGTSILCVVLFCIVSGLIATALCLLPIYFALNYAKRRIYQREMNGSVPGSMIETRIEESNNNNNNPVM